MRGLIEDYYDIQTIRIAVEGQIRAYEQQVSEQELTWLKDNIYTRLFLAEKDIDKRLKQDIKDEPIWTEWLKNVKGIGHILSAGLIYWIGDIEPRMETIIIQQGKSKGKEKEVSKGFETISKLWANAGLAVDEDGRARRRKRGEKANWNAHLKKHLWKIGESFVKTKGGYRELYEQFREDYNRKWSNGDCGSPVCKKHGSCYDLHKFMAAKRKTVKVFLAHYWQKSRMLKGLPIESPFIIGRNGHKHEIPIIEC